jgi:hypothetical protein
MILREKFLKNIFVENFFYPAKLNKNYIDVLFIKK